MKGIKKLFKSLKRSLSNNDQDSCNLIIKEIDRIYRDETKRWENEYKVDLYCDTTFGGLHSLSRCLNNNYNNKIAEKLAICLRYLILHLPEYCLKYAEQILIISNMLMESTAPSLNDIGAQILKSKIFHNLDTSSSVRLLLDRINYVDVKVKDTYFELLGEFYENVSNVSSSLTVDVENFIFKECEQFCKTDNPTMCHGFLTTLSSFYDRKVNSLPQEQIYYKLRSIIQSDETTEPLYCAAIHLLNKHMRHMLTFMTDDFEMWHNIFSKNVTEYSGILKENDCLREISMTFYMGASRQCQERNTLTFQHFYDDIDKLFVNAKLPVHIVKCLKYFFINNTNYFIRENKLIYTLASEFTSACNNEMVEKKDLIGTYVECLTSLVFNKKSMNIVNAHHEAIVLKLLTFIFINYTNLYTSCDLVVSVYNAVDCIYNIQPNLVKKLIFQNLSTLSCLSMHIDKITTQQYQQLDGQISLWKGLIAAEQAGPGHSVLYDCLIEQTIGIFEKLDLDNSKKSFYGGGCSVNTLPSCCNDVKALENLIYLIGKVEHTSSLLILKWIKLFLCKILRLSEKIPHCHGIYRLITTVLELVLLDEKFEEPSPVQNEILLEIFQLLLVTLRSTNMSKPVKRDFLKLLSILPEKIVAIFLDEATETFIDIFKFETSDIEMMINAVLCIENWIQILHEKRMEKFLGSVSPHMQNFAKKETDFINVPFDCDDNLNSKWLLIQQKILQILTADRVPRERNIAQTAEFSLAIAVPDQILKINLSCAVTHIIYLCLNSVVGDSVRIAACEMLNVVATGVVGQCARLCLEEQKEYIPIFELILNTAMKLGCDSNPVINALFHALSVQISRAVSSAYLCESFSITFINLLLDAKNLINEKMRDLAAACIYEFLNFYLKRRNEDGTVSVEMFFEIIIYVLRRDSEKRRVETKVLNILLRQLLENATFFDKYIIYLICRLISCVNLSFLENDYIYETCDIVSNAIKKFGGVICKDNISRIKPDELERLHVTALLSWLLDQCYTGNAQCRAFSMRIYEVLRKVCIQEDLKLEQFTTFDNFEMSTVKKQISLKKNFMPNVDRSNVVDVLNWLKIFHGLLEYEIWLVNEIQMQSSLIESDTIFIMGLYLCIEIIRNKDKTNNPIVQAHSTHLSDQNLASLKISVEIRKVTASLTVKILEFFSIIHWRMFTNTNNFAELLLQCMTQPSALGIESNEENDKVIILYLTKIVQFLKQDFQYLWGELHEQILSSLMNAYLVLSNKLPQILKGIQSYTDSDIDLMSGIKYFMAADDDSNKNQKLIIHLEQLPAIIKSSLKDDDGVWLRDNLRARKVTTELIRLQLNAVKYQQLWQDLTECNCQYDGKLDSCVCQIYFNFFLDIVGHHILAGCDNIHIGGLCSIRKLNIINKLLTHFKYDLLERFLYTLKLTIIDQSQKLIDWADSNTQNLVVLTNLLYSYSRYELQMIDHCKFDECLIQTHFEKWLFRVIKADSNQIDYIPFVIYFSSDLFETFLSHIDKTSELGSLQVWTNLLLYFDILENEVVFFHLLKYLNNYSFSLITASYNCIFNNVNKLSATCQLMTLKTAHQISINETMNFKDKKKFLNKFYFVLLRNMDPCVVIPFYQSIFEDMYSYYKPEKSVCYKIVMIQLLEVMFGTLDRATLEERVLNNSGERIAYDSLKCDLILRCYLARYQTQNSSDDELWRIYQCVSVNCLITLLPKYSENQLNYNFFIFRERSNKCSIWNSLVDSSTSFVFPVYRDSVPEKYYTSFIKAREMDDLIISAPSTSLTQECTIFDFVGHRTTSYPKEKCMYFGCSLEVDSLNEHECMGPICAVIISLGRTAGNAASEEMPMWMKSLNNCMRNPELHINTSSFLLKIIYNTRDIFQCYAKHWMGPILFALDNGACGSYINHFYCQIVSMLISWHNFAIPNTKNYEGKYASRIVTLLSTSIVGKDKKEAERNYLLLSSCLIKWKNVLQFSLETFVPLFKYNDPVELKTGLSIILLFMNNKVMPFKMYEAHSFYDLIVNLSTNILQSIFNIASELIGLFLVYLSESCQRNCLLSQVKIVRKHLSELYIGDKHKFMLELKGISMHYGQIVDRRFIGFLAYICLEPKFQPIHKIAIDILCNICSNAEGELETILSDCGIFQFHSLRFKRDDNDYLNILKLFKSLCEHHLFKNFDLYFDEILQLLMSNNLEVLTATWDLLLLYARKKTIDKNHIKNEVVLSRLIDGIWSRDEATHSTAVRFFLEVYPLSRNVLDVLILLLENLNESIMADCNCVSIILEIILEISLQSPKCSDHYLTRVFDCDYKAFAFGSIENADSKNLINSYHFGDYPYTEITYEMIAKLLLNLGKKDLNCGIYHLVAIVNGLLQETKNYEIKKLKLLACAISKILKKKNLKNSYLRQFLNEIASTNNIAIQRHHDEKMEIVDEGSNEPVQRPPLKRAKYTK